MEEGTFWYVGEKGGGGQRKGLKRLIQVVGSSETVGVGNDFPRF